MTRVSTIRAAAVDRVAPSVRHPGRPMEPKWSLPNAPPCRGRPGAAHSAAIRITSYFRRDSSQRSALPETSTFVAGDGRNGAALSVTTVSTGISKVVYQDKSRNVLAGAWSPDGRRIVFGIGGFAAFFNDFHSQFLKPIDRVEDGAQVAIVNADGTGFRELTVRPGNNAFPSFAPDGKRIVYRTFEKGWIRAAHHEYRNAKR